MRISTIIKQFFQRFFPKKPSLPAIIIPRTEHNISRQNISSNAMKVLHRLQQQGYSAYLVGGCIRDLLLNKKPKDFDIATNARPEKIKKLFRNCLLIGRRFRLAHIRFGREIIEVTTFRAHAKKKSFRHRMASAQGMLLRDNVYGSIEEDAERRDFTINALYYNVADGSLVDYCGGLADIKAQLIRIIGDPETRYQEDPVRFLRAIRFAAKLGFSLEKATAAPIPHLATLLRHVPPARLFEEVLKLFHHGHALASLQLLRQYHLLEELFPESAECINQNYTTAERLLELSCKNTDCRVEEGKTVSPAFLFAVFLWPAVQAKIKHFHQHEAPAFIIFQQAISHVLAEQQKRITIPRRYSTAIREIWDLHQRLIQRKPFMIHRLLAHPRFRAAYDFVLLRAQAEEIPQHIANWWTELLAADEETKQQLVDSIHFKTSKRRKRRGKLL